MDKCPRCGYVPNVSNALPLHNFMNTYVDEKTGKVDGVYNSQDLKISIPEDKKKGIVARTLVRQDVWTAPVETPVVVAPPSKK